jgi:hypothetical protein
MPRTRWILILAPLVLGGCRVTDDPALKAHVAAARGEIARLRTDAEAFVQKNGRCPKAGEVERKSDPWGRPYVVICPGQKGHAADVVSKGVDGDIGTTDDVRSWD